MSSSRAKGLNSTSLPLYQSESTRQFTICYVGFPYAPDIQWVLDDFRNFVNNEFGPDRWNSQEYFEMKRDESL